MRLQNVFTNNQVFKDIGLEKRKCYYIMRYISYMLSSSYDNFITFFSISTSHMLKILIFGWLFIQDKKFYLVQTFMHGCMERC